MTEDKVIDFAAARERSEYEARVRERQSFEDALLKEALWRLKERISAYVGCVRGPLLVAIGRNLVRRLQADPVLVENMAELQQLPIGDQSREQRLATIERAIEQYLPQAVREELPEFGATCITEALRGNHLAH